jgi:Ca2+-binding RTX toxin-like protein
MSQKILSWTRSLFFGVKKCLLGLADASPSSSLSSVPLQVERLESRELLSATITIDYSLDSTGFFDVAERREALEDVAAQLSDLLGDSLDAIAPAGNQEWTPWLFNPGNGQWIAHQAGFNVAQDEIRIFAGAHDLSGAALGRAAPGSFTSSGNFYQTVRERGQAGVANRTDFAPWGGTIMFDDTDYSWHFGENPVAEGSGAYDFRTVAIHEIFHVLGFGLAPSWKAQIIDGEFRGEAVTAEFDGDGYVAVDSSGSHFVNGTLENGRPVLLGPYVSPGMRKFPTALDMAALSDIGWEVLGEFPQSVEAYVESDLLYVNGTDLDDEIRVFRVGNELEVATDQGSLGRFSRDDFSAVRIDSFSGDDTIRISLNVTDRTFIYARDGDDTIYGGAGDDRISGHEGNDRIYGRLGNDTLFGGEGDDRMWGQDGDDYLSGLEGADELRGGIGNDTIYAGEGDDFIDGAGGDDKLFGFNGNDTIFAGGGKDTVYGQNDNDWIYASYGDDLIKGGDGSDVIFGQFGNNRIEAGAGNDSVAGGKGDDTIYGGDGNDRIDGAEGSDLIYAESGDDFVRGGSENDVIFGGDGDDLLYGNKGDDYIFAGLGNDTLHGVDGQDRLYGESGNDLIYGGDGEDFIRGGLGEDRLFGGRSNDVIRGEEGNDYLAGGGGNDQLEGGDDFDLLLGSYGNDQLSGGAGDDQLRGGVGFDLLDGGDGIDTATDNGELGELSIEFS